jgi:hypothetical protein
MHEFTLKLPKLTTKTVWIGFYSEMTGTVAVFWSKKPRWDKTLGHYDYGDPNQIGSIPIEELEAWFGSLEPFVDAGILDGSPRDSYIVSDDSLEAVKITRIKMTAVFDKYGQICGLPTMAYET